MVERIAVTMDATQRVRRWLLWCGGCGLLLLSIGCNDRGTGAVTACAEGQTLVDGVCLNVSVKDLDGDGISDDHDNCPKNINVDQRDTDTDKIGDVCDDDIDSDGILNDKDNCKLIVNADQQDANKNNVGDACEDDPDSDGIANANDNCPSVANADQQDIDGDKIGDACDGDADGDGVNGVLSGGVDCDDTIAAVHPNAPEAESDPKLDPALDYNCDGLPGVIAASGFIVNNATGNDKNDGSAAKPLKSIDRALVLAKGQITKANAKLNIYLVSALDKNGKSAPFPFAGQSPVTLPTGLQIAGGFVSASATAPITRSPSVPAVIKISDGVSWTFTGADHAMVTVLRDLEFQVGQVSEPLSAGIVFHNVDATLERVQFTTTNNRVMLLLAEQGVMQVNMQSVTLQDGRVAAYGFNDAQLSVQCNKCTANLSGAITALQGAKAKVALRIADSKFTIDNGEKALFAVQSSGAHVVLERNLFTFIGSAGVNSGVQSTEGQIVARNNVFLAKDDKNTAVGVQADKTDLQLVNNTFLNVGTGLATQPKGHAIQLVNNLFQVKESGKALTLGLNDGESPHALNVLKNNFFGTPLAKDVMNYCVVTVGGKNAISITSTNNDPKSALNGIKILGVPLFANGSQENLVDKAQFVSAGDFHLGDWSPAINVGISVPATVDFEQVDDAGVDVEGRTRDDLPDIGASEWTQ